MQKYLWSFLLVLFILSCKNESTDCLKYYDVADYSSINSKKLGAIDLLPVTIDQSIESSFEGEFWICSDTLCFTDAFFNYVFWFDENGKLLKQQVGRGKGPNEVINSMYSLPLQNDYLLLNPGNSDLYTFDHHGNKKKNVRLDWQVDRETGMKMLKSPEPESRFCYEFDTGVSGAVEVWDDNYIAIALCGYLPSFNGYFNSEQYYKYSRVLSIVNRKTGKIERILGRRPPLYLEKSNIPNFNHFTFSVLNDCVLLAFYADDKIFALDKQKDKALYSFGVPGRDMNTKYRQTKNYEDAEANWREDYEIYGYYNDLNYDAKSGFLFRTYCKGNNAESDGLQVYKDKKLMTDVDVPIGFRIIGFVKDKLYASVFDENGEALLKLYQVKINNVLN
jgi:hypothetical protein